ncbi:F-box/kelch-repeat protein SKIP25-like [Rutidosis leptorrhynchoides]|uniref:F-box/kelch-repeat protein SKIP25-like n=1 Tax=Rutidosis leptorrhynchoides TaxID=125765 RepID=UPI003A9A6037
MDDSLHSNTTVVATAAKRRKVSDHHSCQTDSSSPTPPPLIPNLPDHVAQLCLSHVHPSILYSVSQSWRRLIYSPSFPPYLSLYTLFSSKDAVFHFFNFDPISATWQALPTPPLNNLVVRHPSFISRSLPVQSISVCGQLIVLAATTHNFFPALSRPMIFNPLSKSWAFGPPFAAPRRWCAAGEISSSVYVASGIGSHFSNDIARSVEKWDLHDELTTTTSSVVGVGGHGGVAAARRWRWEKMRGLKDGRFCREAVDAIGWRGKLCMVNVKGDAPKEGLVYDVKEDTWRQMPEGMVAGWKGPAAAMDEETMYVVDESNGKLRKYDQELDNWVDVLESDSLKGAQQIAAGGGRVCVVCSGGGGIVVVDVVSEKPKIWVVETPPELEAVAVYILPRMSMSQPVTDQ